MLRQNVAGMGFNRPGGQKAVSSAAHFNLELVKVMRSPEAMYLEDVLGIEGYIRPAARATAASTSVTGNVVVALSDVPLINGRQELLKKMRASIHVHNFIALDCTRDEHQKLANVQPSAVVYLGENAQQLVSLWPQVEKLAVTTAILPSLEELTDTSDMTKLQTVKKVAWAQLQSLQRQI